MSSNFETEKGKFGRSPIISIWELDENGNRKEEKPVISFGLKKAKAIVDQMAAIASFVEENGKE